MSEPSTTRLKGDPKVTARKGGYTYPLLVQEIRSAGLTLAEIAAATGVRERQVQNWSSGTSRPAGSTRDRLVDFHYLIQLLLEVYKPQGVEIWLHGRNRSLGDQRPIDLLVDGEFRQVLDGVQRLRVGGM